MRLIIFPFLILISCTSFCSIFGQEKSINIPSYLKETTQQVNLKMLQDGGRLVAEGAAQQQKGIGFYLIAGSLGTIIVSSGIQKENDAMLTAGTVILGIGAVGGFSLYFSGIGKIKRGGKMIEASAKF